MLKERRVGLEVVVIDLLVLLLINCLWKILKPTVGLPFSDLYFLQNAF